jgi:preprotein translocase subunit SecY
MFQTLRNAWKIADLRKKLLFTLFIVVIFRIGCHIPVPFIDHSAVKTMMDGFGAGNLLGYMNMLSGGALSQATIFALSISPYITAQIIVQLLTIAIPALERMSKNGEEGRKQLENVTKYGTIILSIVQAVAYYFTMKANGVITNGNWAKATVIVATFTAGAMLVMWLGNQIDKSGIGNGISMILFAGILAGGPSAATTLWQYFMMGGANYILVPVIIVMFLLIIAFIVLMTNAERRIPVQYAKRVVGRKMYGGNSTNLPIKVNMSGVLPIIFASSVMALPGTIGAFINVKEGTFWDGFFKLFEYNNWFYGVLLFVLIIAFNYFNVAIQYNPVQIANDLRKNNGGVPGIRPGKPTSDFIAKVVSKITLLGGLFLGVMAVLPIIVGALTGINIALGGTTVMILVGVALDTVRELESQMMMRHYKGFLE